MRYIRCARHKGEQNMFAFQYYGNIYYRAFRDIPAGTELLVWYDDKYPQYMGIPLEIRDTYPVSSVGKSKLRRVLGGGGGVQALLKTAEQTCIKQSNVVSKVV